MSLFVVYFEIGKPVAATSVTLPLVEVPVVVTIKGRHGPPRSGVALSNGGSAAPMLSFGNKSVAREGEALRAEFVRFVRQRLASGARPHFCFVMFDGLVRRVEVDADHAVSVGVDNLNIKLLEMSKNRIENTSEVIEVAL